jgi:hypothetical protein
MAGQRVSTQAAGGRAAPTGRKVVQFEARIGYFYETIRGRRVKLLRIEPPSKGRADPLLGFGYVDDANQVIRVGPTVDGFDMEERVASRLLTRVVNP